MAIMYTYDLKGNKLSFANWISNLSPTETPFTSMTKKESVDQTTYEWQVDRLSRVANNAQIEGSDATDGTLAPTSVQQNHTQIFRKIVKVTDTANKVGTYGRSSELEYQMTKAGNELKRDLEATLLGAYTENDAGSPGGLSTARHMKSFKGLVAAKDVADTDTGAIVQFETQVPSQFLDTDIFKMTYNLYLSGSKADTIMVHPKDMHAFNDFIIAPGRPSTRTRMFDGMDNKFNIFVNSIKDPLGQTYRIVPNRYMPQGTMYFFSPSDWTQMVFRSPERTELAKIGSSRKVMLEMEVGLRHRNPYASGILTLKVAPVGP